MVKQIEVDNSITDSDYNRMIILLFGGKPYHYDGAATIHIFPVDTGIASGLVWRSVPLSLYRDDSDKFWRSSGQSGGVGGDGGAINAHCSRCDSHEALR